MYKLSIIIVSWNVSQKLYKNLKAIYTHNQNPNFEIFVVDNNSKDNTISMIEKNFPKVNLIKNKENLGFARANNQAIKLAKGEYILLLNPDMLVNPNTLKNMLNWMDSNLDASIAGPRLIDQKGKNIPHVRRFPTFFDQLAITLKLPHIFPKILDNYLNKNFDYTQSQAVDSIRGAFFMIRKSTIKKLGELDERYFIWFEEVDYCKQAQKAGLKVYYTPAATCIDHIGQSFNQVQTYTKQKYFKESMLKYFKKWHKPHEYYILKIAWGGVFFIYKIIKTLKNAKLKIKN